MKRADALVGGAYVVALALAILVGHALFGRHPVYVAAAADVAATFAVFAFSFVFSNSSFYDPYWSVAPVPIAIYFALVGQAPSQSLSLRSLVVLALVCAWGARLTWSWRRGWSGLGHEDWRYRKLREQTGRAWWLVSALGIHLFPTIQVFLGCLPLYAALAAPTHAFNLFDAVAALVTLVAIVIEATADRQLRAFTRGPKQPAAILATGLWAYSRHPNYFGEMLLWWGLYLFGLAANPAWWWSGVGALSISLMFLFISIPMMDKRMRERRPGYADHMKRVSAVVLWPRPWFRRR